MLILTSIMISFIISIIISSFYIRYFPVRGVKCCNRSKLDSASINIVDVRDYNMSYKDPIMDAINIPIAYMKRYYREIRGNAIHVVARDNIEKNMSIRFLRRRGYNVTGYTLTDCNCKHKIEHQAI